MEDMTDELGVLHEWQSPGCEWEIVTGEEVSRRMKTVSAGTHPGPVSHACPPGLLSGMSEQHAFALAREAGLIDQEGHA